MTTPLNRFVAKMNRLGQEKVPFFFVVDYELNNPAIFPLAETAGEGIFYSINGRNNFDSQLSGVPALQFRKKPVDYATYLEAFEKAIRQIRLGNTFLLNLTFPTEIETNWSLQQIFEKSNAPYRLWYRGEFVVSSPERFVKIADGLISTNPMKGTIDAAIPGAAEQIMADEKEKAEHATIVDLLRNDLSMVAKEVTVKRYRYWEEVVAHDKSLLQVSSEITGVLPTDYPSQLGTIISKLLPAGSICGAPKESTLKIIKETENYSRGYYTGVFGIFDGVNLDSAVMIRFIEQSDGKLWYKSGGGITHFSDPEKEYRELIDKVYVATY